MPSFDIDIEVDEFWGSCSKREKEELLEILRDEGIIPNINTSKELKLGIMESEFFDNLDKLKNVYYQISNDDLDIINKLIKKYC